MVPLHGWVSAPLSGEIRCLTVQVDGRWEHVTMRTDEIRAAGHLLVETCH